MIIYGNIVNNIDNSNNAIKAASEVIKKLVDYGSQDITKFYSEWTQDQTGPTTGGNGGEDNQPHKQGGSAVGQKTPGKAAAAAEPGVLKSFIVKVNMTKKCITYALILHDIVEDISLILFIYHAICTDDSYFFHIGFINETFYFIVNNTKNRSKTSTKCTRFKYVKMHDLLIIYSYKNKMNC